MSGLYLATGAFLLALLQVLLGLAMRGLGAAGRRGLRLVHLAVMTGIVGLSFAHMARNDLAIPGEAALMAPLRAAAPLLAGYAIMAVLVAMLPWSRAPVGPKTEGREAAARGSGRSGLVLGLFHGVGVVAPPLIAWLRPGPPSWPMGVAWSGVAAMAAGFALQTWAQAALGRYYTLALGVDESQPIVATGPYRWVRHPGYLAQMLVWLGFAATSRSSLVLAIVLVAGGAAYGWRIRCEERLLAREQAEAYGRYAGRTWRLIPRVW
jgi:protein-S-isoprenylcysteine O-methyltransferase Ste14